MSRYLVFAMAGIVLLLSSIDATAVAVAFPVITSSLNTTLILAGWVLSGYQLATTVAMPLAGKVSDALGRKFTFMMFLSLFTIGSLLCSVAPNIQLLIAFRIIQGLGGSGFLPSASGIVANEFPRSRQQAIGFFSSIFPIGQIIGPNLGGWMTSALGWRSIFWINIPLGIVALIASALLLSEGQRKKSYIDLPGAGLLAGALVGFMSGLSEMGNGDAEPPWVLVAALLTVSIACMVLFVRREFKVKDPIIESEVLRERPFLAANIYNFTFGCVFGALSLVPLYAVSLYGMSTIESGLILTPRSVGMMLASAVTSLFLVKWGYRWPMLVGTIAIIPGFILLIMEPSGMAVLVPQFGSTTFLLVVMGLVGLGMGIAAPASNNACIELMPHRISTITGIRSMFRQAGSVVSITIGSLLLHNLGMAPGFYIFFLGLAVATIVIMCPLIFAMPKSIGISPGESGVSIQ